MIICQQDCFRDAARELTECPEVAIIQHESGERLSIQFFIPRLQMYSKTRT